MNLVDYLRELCRKEQEYAHSTMRISNNTNDFNSADESKITFQMATFPT